MLTDFTSTNAYRKYRARALRVRSFMQGEGPFINDVRIEQERRVGPEVGIAWEFA